MYKNELFSLTKTSHEGAVDGLQVQGQVSQEIHPLLSGVASSRDGKPELSLGREDLFLLYPLYVFLYIHASLLTFFLGVFVLFYSCCSHTDVFGKTLVLEFHISTCTSSTVKQNSKVTTFRFNFTTYYLYWFIRCTDSLI